jgi:DNA repair protein RecN (Recombination protein N)
VVRGSLSDLDMPDASFSVALEPGPVPSGMPCGAAGAEAPEFRFSANKGEPLRSLQKVASGGELSRVFLAVKNGLRRVGAGMVLVFDEVDAGIGGRAAERVGRALAELAMHHQVICITHLPQIAAFADVHFRVEKRERGGRTLASVARLEGEARVDEVARMAGGASVSEATRRHARDLLKVKKTAK